jgi:hypothetical protein
MKTNVIGEIKTDMIEDRNEMFKSVEGHLKMKLTMNMGCFWSHISKYLSS